MDWWSLFTAAISGSFAVKLLDIAYGELKDWKTKRNDHSRDVDRSLEPLLKCSDELVGKLRSLAEQDFIPIIGANSKSLSDPSFASVVYLFVQFWSEVEFVRFKGLSTRIAKSERGKQTQAFLKCLESRRARLIDRISQRAIGEAAQIDGRTMNYVEFIKSVDADPYMFRWLEPLLGSLGSVNQAHQRQRVLQYFVILHALIDTLDSDHTVTRDRPGIPNKLDRKSRRDLSYRVFGVYLTFVVNRPKYLGPLN